MARSHMTGRVTKGQHVFSDQLSWAIKVLVKDLRFVSMHKYPPPTVNRDSCPLYSEQTQIRRIVNVQTVNMFCLPDHTAFT